MDEGLPTAFEEATVVEKWILPKLHTGAPAGVFGHSPATVNSLLAATHSDLLGLAAPDFCFRQLATPRSPLEQTQNLAFALLLLTS